MSAKEEIGRCRCPVCGNLKAHLRVNVKQLAYVMCNTCNVQIQARSDRSDELLRALYIGGAAPTMTPPADVSTPTPAAAAAALAARPEPVALPAWGFLR